MAKMAVNKLIIY